jgi:hypothetical protein
MPTFLSRRYARRIENVGATEKIVGVFLLLLTVGLVAALAVQVATDETRLFDVGEAAYSVTGSSPRDTRLDGTVWRSQAVGVRLDDTVQPHRAAGFSPRGVRPHGPFPHPAVEGWRAPRQVSRYSPDDLYVKINGRAEEFLRFHVASLTFGTYEHRTDADRTIDVYLYDMGEPANAAGIYRAEAAPGATPVAVGTEGYQIGPAVFFRKGASYVQLLPSGLDEADARAALVIAGRLAERMGNGEW